MRAYKVPWIFPNAGLGLTLKGWPSVVSTGTSCQRLNLKKWKIKDDDLCTCGVIQDMPHLLLCPELEIKPVTQEDLIAANDVAIKTAIHWKNV